MAHLSCHDNLYNRTELYSPVGGSTLHSTYGVPLNYFDPRWEGPNGNLLHTLHEERMNSAMGRKKKKKKKTKIRMCYNCKASTTGERKSTADNCSYLNDKYISKSKKGDYKHARINIRTDGHSTESDYTDGTEDTVPTLDKWKKPRKKFMGKYFFSEIANSLLHPWNVYPSTVPQLGVVNPHLDCLHYSIGAKRKWREHCIKPEIIVRF
ncbi:Uncharacterized protein PCOAH_00043890 [Plasmodium coatneyi]|uniref:Uncharacterized protein n=1 Tax=Plasmodium coatneyi TaxID=208452 RepID=A0A1B1E5Z4_9APIC|nr:Uncharacterized protein PCOAH_00043890 [Plasmodium coatneyi]ANQ10179.1 Uncharacterized protein PCOAH_00043890 [Plasmodium coatneyi]